MSTIPETRPRRSDVPELHSGDRMTQKEFHRLYEQTPEKFKAELIGGIVYVSSPLRWPHGVNHLPLGTLFCLYGGRTPGVECGDNATVILDDENEPQPDLFLRILPEYGGQSRTNEDEYLTGAPELLAEIAHSSHSIDLYDKRSEYARNGVQEYLVLTLSDQRLRWFDLRSNQELTPDADGVYRLLVFPGLWIHVEALLARDIARLVACLEQGLATPEHAAFVQRLAARRDALRNQS
jgi:Uma2 family endonuclease